MRWHFEGDIPVIIRDEDPYNIFTQASGTLSEDDFEIDDLCAYDQIGHEMILTEEQDEFICEWLSENDDIRQQAYESAGDDAYERWKDRD